MFEEQRAGKVVQFSDCIEFLKLYERFKQDILDPQADRVRIAKFEIKIDNAWHALPQDKRDILTATLLAKKLLPEEVGAALKVFQGKVVSLS